jgi:hypothetical protein
MGRDRAHASTGQRRQKRHHDPQHQVEEDSPPSPTLRELRPNRRPGKEPAGSSQTSTRAARQAPYMMPSMAVPPPSRANPSRRGIAWDICPRTPPRLQIEYQEDQRQYPRCRSFPVLKFCLSLLFPWEETTSSKRWHSQMHARRTCTSTRRRKTWKGDFGVSCIKISTPLLSCARARPLLSLASMLTGHILRGSMIHSSIKPLQSARNSVPMTSWGFGTIRMRRYLLNFTHLYFMMQGKLLFFEQLRE